MHWTRQFVTNDVNATDFDVVTTERLNQYVDQLDDFTHFLKTVFPTSLLIWRDLPSTPVGRDQAWGLSDLQNYRRNGHAKMFRNSYIDSLNIAAQNMFKNKYPDLTDLPWNKASRNIITWSDDVHPDGNSLKFVVNMWLYYLKLLKD